MTSGWGFGGSDYDAWKLASPYEHDGTDEIQPPRRDDHRDSCSCTSCMAKRLRVEAGRLRDHPAACCCQACSVFRAGVAELEWVLDEYGLSYTVAYLRVKER